MDEWCRGRWFTIGAGAKKYKCPRGRESTDTSRPCGHRLAGDEAGLVDALTGISRADTASGVGWQGSVLALACMKALTGVSVKSSMQVCKRTGLNLPTFKGWHDRIRVERENGD